MRHLRRRSHHARMSPSPDYPTVANTTPATGVVLRPLHHHLFDRRAHGAGMGEASTCNADQVARCHRGRARGAPSSAEAILVQGVKAQVAPSGRPNNSLKLTRRAGG